MSEPIYHQFKLRLPKELFDRLGGAAYAENRSVGAEIVSRLEASFSPGEMEKAVFENILRRISDQALEEIRAASAEALRESKERLAVLEAEKDARARQEVQRSLAGNSEVVEPKPKPKGLVGAASKRVRQAAAQTAALSAKNRYDYLMSRPKLSAKERGELARIVEKYGDPPKIPSLYDDE